MARNTKNRGIDSERGAALATMLGPTRISATASQAAVQAPAKPQRKTPVQMSRAGKKAVSYYLDREKFLQLKMLSVQTGKPLQLLNEEALRLLLASYAEAVSEALPANRRPRSTRATP